MACFDTREREVLLERERERERHNRMGQVQGYRDRRRCMALSPTRLQSRSPHLQYIHRGRANIFFATSPPSPTSPLTNARSPIRPTGSASIPINPPSSSSVPSSISAMSPDTEPMFQMSPVGMQCFPPLRNAEPINVMTLRNWAGPPNQRSRLRAKSIRAAVPPLLYTFPRPNPNSNSNRNSNVDINPNSSSISHSKNPKLTSIKRPFSLVSQNHDIVQISPPKISEKSAEESCSESGSPLPPLASSLFLDLSLTPHPPPPFLVPSKRHVRIAPDPIAHDEKYRLSRSPWTNCSKKKSRAPTPMPSPKIRDAPKPVLTNVTVTRTRLSSPLSSPLTAPAPLKRIPSLPIPIPYHSPRKEDTGLFEDVSVSRDGGNDDDHKKSDNEERNANTASRQRLNDLVDENSGFPGATHNCLGLGLPFSLPDSSLSSYPSPPLPLQSTQLLIPTGDLFNNSDTGICMQQPTPSSLSPEVGFILTSKESDLKPTLRKGRSKEIIEAEYFDNSVDEEGNEGTNVDRGIEHELNTYSSSFVPTSQGFETLQPVFPAFSIAPDSDSSFGFGMDNSCLHLNPDVIPSDQAETNNLNETRDPELEKESPSPVYQTEQQSNSNPWSSAFNSSHSSSLNSVHTGHNIQVRNGKADLMVFNPRPVPHFGDDRCQYSNSHFGFKDLNSGFGFGSGSNPRLKSISGSGPSSHSTSQFLSFPIPIFNTDSPFAEATAVTTVLVRKPTSVSESIHWNKEEEEMSFRSSVYGGCFHGNGMSPDSDDSLEQTVALTGGQQPFPSLPGFQSPDSSSPLVYPSLEPKTSTQSADQEVEHPEILSHLYGRKKTASRDRSQRDKQKETHYGGLLKKIVGLKTGIGTSKQ